MDVISWNFSRFQYSKVSSKDTYCKNLYTSCLTSCRITQDWILKNQQILAKSQNWLEGEPSARSPFQKRKAFNSGQKLRKNNYQSFLFLPCVAWFLFFQWVKSVYMRSYSGPHFPTFGLNTERYGVYLRVQSECGKIRTRIAPNTNTFYAVFVLYILSAIVESIKDRYK